jgi:hypothetical protein
MQENLPAMTLVGRHSSLFTRVPLFFAAALEVPLGFEPVMDMKTLSPAAYGGNPALKLPALREGEACVFGASNICRRIAARAPEASRALLAWPEDVAGVLAANAQEMLVHAMNAQVQYVMGVVVAGLPEDNVFFSKTRAGFQGALQWLDDHLDDVLATLPQGRLLSLFEVSLFCLVEHLAAVRPSLPLAPYPRLVAFGADYGRHPAARATSYRFDPGAR